MKFQVSRAMPQANPKIRVGSGFGFLQVFAHSNMMANNESLDVYGMKIDKLFEDLDEDLDTTKEVINKLTENLQNTKKKLIIEKNCPKDDSRYSFMYSWSISHI